jgi:hypothetical protein
MNHQCRQAGNVRGRRAAIHVAAYGVLFDRKTDRVALLAILVVGAATRVIGLTAHDFWYDEALEIIRDRLPWPRILVFAGGPDPPLFRVLMSPVARWSSSEALLRAPSVAFSLATIWLVERWLARLGDARLGLATAMLLAISPVQVYYAQEVSQYALSGMVAAATLLAMQMALDRGATRDWIAFTVASIGALLTYYGLVFLLLSVNLVLLWHVRRGRDAAQTRRFLLSLALALAVTALLAWAMLAQQYVKFAADHALQPLVGGRSAGELLVMLGGQLVHDVAAFVWLPWSEGAPRWLLAPPIALALLGTALLVIGRQRLAVVPLVLGTSLAAMVLASVLGWYPLGFRYAYFLAPLQLALVAAGLLWLLDRARGLGLATAAFLVGSQLAFLPQMGGCNPYVAPPYENLSRALRWVVARGEPTTPVYLYYGSWAAFALYKHQLGSQPVVRGSNLRPLSAADRVAAVQRETADYPRVFVVGSHLWQHDQSELLDGLLTAGGGRRLVASTDERGAFAALLENSGPEACLRSSGSAHGSSILRAPGDSAGSCPD